MRGHVSSERRRPWRHHHDLLVFGETHAEGASEFSRGRRRLLVPGRMAHHISTRQIHLRASPTLCFPALAESPAPDRHHAGPHPVRLLRQDPPGLWRAVSDSQAPPHPAVPKAGFFIW